MRYIDGKQKRDADEADRNGVPHDRIAGYLQITVEDLELHVLERKTKPAAVQAVEDLESDLWATDRLDELL